jgi:hypothetical protein
LVSSTYWVVYWFRMTRTTEELKYTFSKLNLPLSPFYLPPGWYD